MTPLRVERLTKSFPGRNGTVEAVKQLCLKVAEAELLVLLGPSGCGKSTTLRLIAGLEVADSGWIELDGQRIENLAPEKRPVSVAFQSPALFPQLSVLGNVELGLRLRQVPRPERLRRVEEMLALLEIGSLGGRYPHQLSGGQQQRVSLARALAISPRVFLLDEPLSSLDPGARVQLRSTIQELQKRTRTPMLYVTHDQAEAMAIADRVAVMSAGTIEQTGTPSEIYHRPRTVFVARFIGSPAMNLLPGKVRAKGTETICELSGTGLAFPAPAGLAPGSQVTVGIRPEHLEWGEAQEGSIEARVIAAVPAFPEVHLELEAGGLKLAARIPEGRFRTGPERVFLRVQPEFVHFFDPGTGRRLG